MAPRDFRGKLKYYSFEHSQRPFMFTRKRHEDEMEKFSCDTTEPVLREVTILDGRERELELNTHSFQLVESPTVMRRQDFLNPETLRGVYFKEVEALMRKVTGAKEVFIFNHFLRCNDEPGGTNEVGENNTNGILKSYSSAIHTDSHAWSAEQTRAHFVKATNRPDLATCRLVYLTCWRSINDDPVVDNHLCLADPASIAFPDDLVMREQYAFDKDIGDYNILQYGLTDRNTDRHRWYYFPGITRQQAILHKQYDSDPSVPGRFCFHAASPDPEAPKNIPARASMEVRGLCFFPDDQKQE